MFPESWRPADRIFNIVLCLTLTLTLTHCDRVRNWLGLAYAARVAELPGIPLYPNASLDGPPIGHLPYNTALRAIQTTDNAVRVFAAEKQGWVSRYRIRASDTELQTLRFVRALEGAALFDAPDGLIQRTVDYGSQVLCLEQRDTRIELSNGGYIQGWIRVRINAHEGWLPSNQLSETPTTHYFMAVARSGLNVRAAPDLNARIIALIPAGEIGVALRRESRVFTIESRKGAWLAVEYDGKRGFVFSGFVALSTSHSMLSEFSRQNIKAFFALYEDVAPVDNANAMFTPPDGHAIAARSALGAFTLIETRPLARLDECDQQPRRNLFVTSSAGHTRLSLTADVTEIQATPAPASLIATQSHCNCCCPWITSSMILARGEHVYQLPFFPGHLNGGGECLDGPTTEVHYGREYRVSPDKTTLYMLLRFPECAGRIGEFVESGYARSTAWDAELFVRLRAPESASEIKVDRVFDSGVPEEYRAEWVGAQPLYAPETGR